MRARRIAAIAAVATFASLSGGPLGGSALADELEAPLRLDFPDPDDNRALTEWRESHPWQYDDGYVFGVTKGLTDAGVPEPYQYCLWIVTVPFDIANLPFAAAAGLFGN